MIFPRRLLYLLIGQGVCFFVVAPFCSCPASLVSRKFFAVGPGCAKCFFFCCTALGAATFRRGQSKKNTTQGVFFFCSGPGERQGKDVPARGFSFPCLSPGPEQKKKHPWVVFFVLLRPRADAHSLTAGLGGDASPSPGWCFFFLLRPRPDRGGVFFLLWPRPDAHSLTVSWGDFGKARVVFFFFAAAPPGLFRQ